MTHHLRIVEHQHKFLAYELVNEEGDIYFRGWKCACGEDGYEIPGPKDQPQEKPNGHNQGAGVSTVVGGVVIGGEQAPRLPSPTARDWQDHLDEEHEDDERSDG